ncbi:DoxX family protein [Oerskovia flava]|uniref:DoxX family protein n=1 Tax=Oerskovia flava TaxID=2986422 RepID=UPI002AD2F6D7|nr:DoxX family protein [Oerskovia sp. JB1-3-2]
MIAHGAQKVFTFTLSGTGAAFGDMGIPAAGVAGPAVALFELVGGVALLLGLGTRVVAALYAVTMLGALFLVHLSAGFFAGDGGYELVLVLAAAAAALALTGPGVWSVDAWATRRSTRR